MTNREIKTHQFKSNFMRIPMHDMKGSISNMNNFEYIYM